MSNLVCGKDVCTFTRVDTNGYGINPYLPSYPVIDPAFNTTYDDGSLYGNDTLAPWTTKTNQDLISPAVAITRDFRGGIFNALVPGDQNSYDGPTGTEWTLLPEGKTFEEVRCSLRFCSWLECFAQFDVNTMINKPGVVHLIDEDLYYNIMFTNWTTDGDYPSYLPPLPKRRRAQDGRTAKRRRAQEGRTAKGGRRTQEGRRETEGRRRAQAVNRTLGGGFQYVRGKSPITYDHSLTCPKCDLAKASPAELTGPVDNSWQEVSITGVTPGNSGITITAVGQDHTPRCNIAKSGGNGLVSPNAMGVGNSTVELRRTVTAGELNPFIYTVFFKATTAAGTCNGQVTVCSAPEGMDCSGPFNYYGFDATATEYCAY